MSDTSKTVARQIVDEAREKLNAAMSEELAAQSAFERAKRRVEHAEVAHEKAWRYLVMVLEDSGRFTGRVEDKKFPTFNRTK